MKTSSYAIAFPWMFLLAAFASAAPAGLLVASSASAQEDVTFKERYRPQFHYTAVKGWINDPIGLLYHEGEYHLFNDHNVKSTRFPGGKFDGEQSHWSHAVSKDLVHWKHMPVAVYPDKLGACWSGSGVVDWKNTTGLQTGKEPPLALAYTSAGSWGQSLVYSNDRGRTWTKYQGNPVLDKIADNNRDPQVFWHEPTKKWIMVLYVRRGQAHFLNSDDMKTWTATSVVPLEGFHECPDMFTLPVDGDPKNCKWVVYDGPFHYWIGDFDGKKFQPQTEALRCEFGRNFHAAQSWETPDHRRVQIGWMNGGVYPGMPFNQQMTFPCELTLRTTADGVRLFMYPIEAIQSLYTKSFSLNNHVLKPGDNPLADVSGDLFDIEMAVEPGDATEFGLRLHETAVIYSDNQVTSAGAKAEVSPIDGVVTLRILVDRTSIETFVNRGQVALPCCYLPKKLNTGLDLYAKGDNVKIRSLRVTGLKPCWESRDTQSRKADVQPVLDRHCVGCHGGDRKMAGLDLRGELTQAFSISYERLLRYVKTTDEGSDFGGSEYLPPKSVGSHASRLIQRIDKGCTGMKHESGKIEVYDLSHDRAEKNNLADKHPDIARKLGELMDNAWIEPRSQEDDGVYKGK